MMMVSMMDDMDQEISRPPRIRGMNLIDTVTIDVTVQCRN